MFHQGDVSFNCFGILQDTPLDNFQYILYIIFEIKFYKKNNKFFEKFVKIYKYFV